jgi:hypothetical protein
LLILAGCAQHSILLKNTETRFFSNIFGARKRSIFSYFRDFSNSETTSSFSAGSIAGNLPACCAARGTA